MVDKLFNMEPLNGCKPTELLATMVKLRSPDHAHLFTYLCLQRLPMEVQILLAKEDVNNMQALLEKADDMVAYHRPQHHDVALVELVAELADDSEAVAVVMDANGGARVANPLQWSIGHHCAGCTNTSVFSDKARPCEQLYAWPNPVATN
jgi:hypothetical protein